MSNGSRVLTTSYRWRLRELMAQSGYHTATALHAALNNRGVALSQSQVCRIVSGTPERVSLTLMVGLCSALACSPSDLVSIESPAAQTGNYPDGRILRDDTGTHDPAARCAEAADHLQQVSRHLHAANEKARQFHATIDQIGVPLVADALETVNVVRY